MSRTYKTNSRKYEIVKIANSLFLEKGFTNTTASEISKALDISTGNLTYHFPTKEHLLYELVKELCEFQWDTINKYVELGTSPLLAYALEIAAQTALCDEDEIARDFYVSAYTLPMTLAEIRQWDAKKAQMLFAAYNPNWQDMEYMIAENSASGLELSALMTECNEAFTLEIKIASTLENLMRIYNIPESKRRNTIDEVLKLNYSDIGKGILIEFKNFLKHNYT